MNITEFTIERKNKILKEQYDTINNIVLNQSTSIEKACQLLNMHKSKYSYICKKLNLPSVRSEEFNRNITYGISTEQRKPITNKSNTTQKRTKKEQEISDWVNREKERSGISQSSTSKYEQRKSTPRHKSQIESSTSEKQYTYIDGKKYIIDNDISNDYRELNELMNK